MNFVAGLLLMYMPTEGHAFAALVMLMEESGLRRFYGNTMALLQVWLMQGVFGCWVSGCAAPTDCNTLDPETL